MRQVSFVPPFLDHTHPNAAAEEFAGQRDTGRAGADDAHVWLRPWHSRALSCCRRSPHDLMGVRRHLQRPPIDAPTVVQEPHACDRFVRTRRIDVKMASASARPGMTARNAKAWRER